MQFNHSETEIPLIPFSEIIDLKEIARGDYSSIYEAIWNDEQNVEQKKVAIKKFLNQEDYDTYFQNEYNSHFECCNCGCINRCLGITKDPESNNYMFVLEFAKGGNLYDYLQTNFSNITWEEKGQILLEISIGRACILLYFSFSYCDNSLNLAIAKFCPIIRKLSVGFKNNELENVENSFKSHQYLKSYKFWHGVSLLSKKEKCLEIWKFKFRTLIACLPNSSKEILHKNGIIISPPTSKPPMFNYATFCKVLSINQVHYMLELLLKNQQPTLTENDTLILSQEIFKHYLVKLIL
ncbi:hypothetical protein C1645_829882 [Glomus cerebriforme]|uniref:Protein kinase domain-containing protein n=1 Tax=Glomus cerebriforme TaxID=658196 RepID=A0A397SIR4_9GLOM|nr:hypothetical protein C1645_829882 [Glomus cerebriforme]